MLNEQSKIRRIKWDDIVLMIVGSHMFLPLVIGISFGIGLGTVMMSQGASPEEIEQATFDYDTLITGIGIVGSVLIPCLLIYFKKIPLFNRKRLSKREWKIFPGLETKDWKFLGWYMPVSYILFIAGSYLMDFLFEATDHTNQELIEESMGHYPLWMMALMILVLGPFIEEFLFRGVMFFRKENNEVSWLTLIVTSILFGLAHTPTTIPAIYTYVGMGLLFGYAAKRTQSMEAAIVYHLINNSIAFISLLALS